MNILPVLVLKNDPSDPALHAKATWGKTLKTRCTWRLLMRGKYKKENKNLICTRKGSFGRYLQPKVST